RGGQRERPTGLVANGAFSNRSRLLACPGRCKGSPRAMSQLSRDDGIIGRHEASFRSSIAPRGHSTFPAAGCAPNRILVRIAPYVARPRLVRRKCRRTTADSAVAQPQNDRNGGPLTLRAPPAPCPKGPRGGQVGLHTYGLAIDF